ncbi:MAG: hypothetical protein ACRDDZ_06945 [Marinifilaceae bacterium]
MKLSAEARQELHKAQQNKLDTSVIYKYLSQRAKHQEMKDALQRVATDAARHSTILKKFSGMKAERKEKPAFRFRMLIRFLGVKAGIRVMLETEIKNTEAYAPAAKQNPDMKIIYNDGKKNVRILQDLILKKKK